MLYFTTDSPLLRAEELYFVSTQSDPERIICIGLADHQLTPEDVAIINALPREEAALLSQCHYLLTALTVKERVRYNDLEDSLVNLTTLVEDIESGHRYMYIRSYHSIFICLGQTWKRCNFIYKKICTCA